MLFDIDVDGDLDIIGQDRYANHPKLHIYENRLARSLPPPPPIAQHLRVDNIDIPTIQPLLLND